MYINIKNIFALAVGKKKTLTIANKYYDSYLKTWRSANTNIATVSKTGSVTAKKLGKTDITCTIAGRDVTTQLFVYKLNNLTFNGNSKTAYTTTYQNKDKSFENDTDTIYLTVNQKTLSGIERQTAQTLYLLDSTLGLPTVSSSNKNVADVYLYESEDFYSDTIRIHIIPKKPGKTKITVKFGGKKATLTYNVKQSLLDDWFKPLPYTEVEYKGSSYKPLVTKSDDSCREDNVKPTYQVKYSNNVNAGEAIVSIVGTGNYSGTVTRKFTITPRNLSFNGKYGEKYTAAKIYTGQAVKPSLSILYKKTELVKNKDYKVLYKKGYTYVDAPINVGTYTVIIEGIGNYAGKLETNNDNEPQTFTVKQVPFSKLTLSCPTKIKWQNGALITPNVKLMYKDYIIPEMASGSSQKNYEYSIYKASDTSFSKPLSNLTDKGTYVLVLKALPVNSNKETANISVSDTDKPFVMTFVVK